MGDYWLDKTPGGKEFWRVGNMAAVDEHPSLLASMMPIFHVDEPSPNAATWNARIRALESERAMRAADPKRTIHGDSSAAA